MLVRVINTVILLVDLILVGVPFAIDLFLSPRTTTFPCVFFLCSNKICISKTAGGVELCFRTLANARLIKNSILGKLISLCLAN